MGAISFLFLFVLLYFLFLFVLNKNSDSLKKIIWFLTFIAFGATGFAAYTSQCDLEYEQCMIHCCSSCNATIGMEENRPVCWIWATKTQDQNCMNKCAYCNDDFRACKGLPPSNNQSNQRIENATILGSGTGNRTDSGWNNYEASSNKERGELCGVPLAFLGIATLVAFSRR